MPGFFSQPLVQCMISAMGFASWPIVQRMTGLPLSWAVGILTIMQLPAVLVVFQPGAMPSARNIVLFTLFGAIPNGVAIISYLALLGQKGDIISKWLPAMAVMMPIVGVIGAVFLLGEALSLQKICGIAAACLSIYLLSTS